MENNVYYPEVKRKEDYIERWGNYINTLHRLAWTLGRKEADEVMKMQDRLKELVNVASESFREED